MNDQDLAKAIRDAAATDVPAPAFDEVWATAEAGYYQSRRRYAWFASAAATVAAIVIMLNIGTPPSIAYKYVEMAELMDSTSWTAPSDVLLPDHQIDLYQDLPTLTGSTKPAEGALL